MMLLLAGITIATACAISAAGTIVAMKLARKWNFIDYPCVDRFHKVPTPLLGGVPIFAAIFIPTVAVITLAGIWNAIGVPAWLDDSIKIHIPGVLSRLTQVVAILTGAIFLCIIGLIDDKRPMGPWLKLAGQVLVAVGVVLIGKIRLLELAGEPISSIATVLWLVLITNAINFMDNMDGLAAGVVAICSAALLASAATAGQLFVAGWLCLILGASIGFLPFNFPPAKIFMGDAGSLPMGFMLGITSVLTTYYHGGQAGVYYSIFTPVVAMAIPLYDTLSVILLRIRRGTNPMAGDKRHFSHRLLRLGMTQRKALFTIYLATATTAASAALLPHIDPAGAMILFAQTLAVVLIIALLESTAIGSNL